MAPAPTSQSSRQMYKKSYKPTAKLEVFFTGGRVALSADSSFVVCPCSDQVKVVDIATSGVRQTFPGDSEPITAVAVSPDGQSAFSSSRSLQTKWWDVATGECKRSWKAHDGPVACMATDASGGLLATGSASREVRVWDVERGYCTHSFRGHLGVISCVAFHPDPHRLLLFSAGEDGLVQVWDLVTRSSVARLDKHFSPVTGLAFSPSGRTLLSGGRDKVANVWSLRDYSLQSTIPVFESLEGICALPDSCPLPGAATSEAPKLAKKGVECVRFLTVGERGIVRVWRSDSGACTYEQKASDVATLAAAGKGGEDAAKGGAFTGAALMGSGSQLLCTTADQRLLVYRGSGHGGEGEGLGLEGGEGAEGGEELQLSKQLIGYNDEVIDLRFVDMEEKLLAVATNSEQVRVYDVSTMACVQSLVGHTDIVLCLDTRLSPIGRPLLVSAGKDHSVRVWDVGTASCLGVATGHVAAVSAVAFSKKTCSFLVSGGSDRTLKVWSLEGLPEGGVPGEPPLQLKSKAVVAAHDKDINSVAISPNDALACSGSQDRTAKVWRLPQLAPHLTLRGHRRGVWSVAFSPVDQAVLTASGDLTVRIWALGDGACLKTLEGHTGSVLKASFLTRGTQIVSSGADGLVKLWTIRSGECVNTFDHHEDKVWALTVSPQTEMLATGGSDSLVNVWTDCTAAEEEEAVKEQEEELLRDQALSNALADADYLRAVQLAFELRRPFKMLSVFSELFRVPEAEERLQRLIKGIEGEQLKLLMEYVREWNTNSRHCHVAQRVLAALLRSHPPSALLQVSGLREVVEGLVPYTQRHFSRIDRLVRSTFLLDYTLASMAVLGAVHEDDDPVLLRVTRQKEKEAALDRAKKKAGNKKRKREAFLANGIAGGHGRLDGASGEAEGEVERALGEVRGDEARVMAGPEEDAAEVGLAAEPGGTVESTEGKERANGEEGPQAENEEDGDDEVAELGSTGGNEGSNGEGGKQGDEGRGLDEESAEGKEGQGVGRNGDVGLKGKVKRKETMRSTKKAKTQEIDAGGRAAMADVVMGDGADEEVSRGDEGGRRTAGALDGGLATSGLKTPTTTKKKKKVTIGESPEAPKSSKSKKEKHESLVKRSPRDESNIASGSANGNGEGLDEMVRTPQKGASKSDKSRQKEENAQKRIGGLLEELESDVAKKVKQGKKLALVARGASLKTPKTDKKQKKKAREKAAAMGAASV